MDWRQTRRHDREGLVEFICEHGCGHPAFGSALFIAEAIHGADSPKVDEETQVQLAHGCCGCCERDDFPGTVLASLKHAHKLLREYLKQIENLTIENDAADPMIKVLRMSRRSHEEEE